MSIHSLPIASCVPSNIIEENCSTEKSSECDTGYYLYLEVMYIYILCALLAFGIFGNSLSVVVFIKQSRKKTSSKTTAMLICFAAADTLFLASSIFTRLLPTLSTYVFLGKTLSWSIHFRPYATAIASMLQTFASYMVLLVTLQRYILITKPIAYLSVLSNGKMYCAVGGVALFSVAFSIVRFFELHVVTKCKVCLGVVIPIQARTDLGKELYFNIVYNIILRTIFRGMVPIIGVAVMTKKLSAVSEFKFMITALFRVITFQPR